MIIAKKHFFTKLGLLILVIFVNHSHASDSQVFDRLTKITNGSAAGAAAIVGVCALFYNLYRKKTADPKSLITSDEHATVYFESHKFDNNDLFWLIKQGYITTFSKLISTIDLSDLVKIKNDVGFNLFDMAIVQEKYDFAKLIFDKLQDFEIMAPIAFPGVDLVTLKEKMDTNLTFLLFLLQESSKSEFDKNRLLFILEQYPKYLNELDIIDRSNLLAEVHDIEDPVLITAILKKVNDGPKLQYPA